jgi:autotransporter-associated beta strand protein
MEMKIKNRIRGEKRKIKLALALAVTVSSSLAGIRLAHGATASWTDGSTADWGTSGHWTGGTGTGGSPASADTAEIGGNSIVVYSSTDGATTIAAITLGKNASGNKKGTLSVNGGTLTISGAVTIGGSSSSPGELDIAGGILSVGTGGIASGGSSPAMTISSGTLEMNGNNIASLSTFNFNGGILQDIGTVSSAIVLGSGQQTINQGAYAGSITGTVSGAGGLIKNGAGTVTLATGNTYNGVTTINAGFIATTGESAFGTAPGSFTANQVTLNGGGVQASGDINFNSNRGITLGTSGGTFDSNGNTITLTNDVAGTGRIIKIGTGSLVLIGTNGTTGSNTYSGGVMLTAGVLDINSTTGLGTSAGTLTISGGTIDNTSGGAITDIRNNPVSIGSSFTFTGSNALNLGTGTVTLTTSNPTITANASTLTLGGVLAGSYGFTKSGNGTLILSGVNTYTGGTTLTAGVLDINSTTALGTSAGTLSITGAGTIDNTSGGGITLANNNPVSIGSSFTFTGSNALNLGTGTVTLTTSNPTITANASTLTLGGVLAGSNGFTKAGNGTLILSGVNTYTGGTTINAGVLTLNNSNALAGGGNITFGGGTLQFTSNNTVDYSNKIVSSTAGPIAIDVNGQTVNFGSSLVGSNTGGLKLASTAAGGTLVLGASNAYTGLTTISAGTLQLNNNGAIGGGGNITFSGGTLQYTTNNTVDYSGKIVSSTAGPIAVDVNGQAITYASSLASSNTGGLTLTSTVGGGTLTLSASNAYTGGTTVSSGLLLLTGSLANTATTISGGAILRASGSAPAIGTTSGTTGVTVAGGSSAATRGTLTLSDGSIGTLTLSATSGTNALSIGTSSNPGVLTFDVGSTADKINIPTAKAVINAGGAIINIVALGGLTGVTQNLIATNSALTVNGTPTLGTVTGTVNGYTLNITTTSSNVNLTETPNSAPTNAFWKGGIDGNWNTFSGVNNTNWITTVSGSTDTNQIPLSATNVFMTANSAATVGTITLGQNFNVNSLSFTGGSTSAASNNFTLAGNTLTLSAGSGFSDQTATSYVAGIGLVVQSGSAAHTINSAVALGNNQSWEIDNVGKAFTVNGVISGAFNLLKTGAGTLALAGTNTFGSSSAVTLQVGTLDINNASALGSSTNTFKLSSTSGTITIDNTSGGAITTSNYAQTWHTDFTFTGSNALNMGNGLVTLDNGSRIITVSASTLTIGGAIGDGGSTWGITKSGAGTLVVSGASSYKGGTTISSGVLNVGGTQGITTGPLGGGTGSLPTGSITFGGGTLQFSSANQTDYSSKFATSASQAFNIDTNGQTVTFGTALTSTGGSLTKLGTGILKLTATANAYTGGTTVSAGTLELTPTSVNQTNNGIFGSSSLTISGTVQVDSDNALTGSGSAAANTVPVTINAGGVLTGLATANGGIGPMVHIRGLLTIAGGTLASGGTGPTMAGSWELDGGVAAGGVTTTSTMSALSIDPSQSGGTQFNVSSGATSGIDLDVTGTIIHGTSLGDTGIIKLGTGVMQLDSSNSYNGATTISAGQLKLTGAFTNNISSTSQISLAGGATLNVSGLTSSTLVLNQNLLATGSGTATFTGSLNAGANTVDIHGITGAGSLAISGGLTLNAGTIITIGDITTTPVTVAGALNLTGSNTFNVTGMATTAGLYKLLAYGSATGAGSFTTTGLNANYTLVNDTTNKLYELQHKATIGTIAAQTGLSVITGGSVPFTITVANSAVANSSSLQFSAAAGTNTTGSITGPISVSAQNTSAATSGLSFNGTTVGATQTGSFTVNDANSTNSGQSGTVTVNVLGHSNAALGAPTNNNQTIITGGTLNAVTLSLTDAGTNLAALSVSTLSNLTGTTGTGAVVASGGAGTYTATGFDTTTVGVNKTLTTSLKAGDEQDLNGFSAQTTLSQNVTYTVLGHASAALNVATNPIYALHNATSVSTGLTLTDGTSSNAGLVVTSVGSGISGVAVNDTVAGGGTKSGLAAALSTSTVGLSQNQNFSVGYKDQSLPGADPATYNATAGVTVNVYNPAAAIQNNTATSLALQNNAIGPAADLQVTAASVDGSITQNSSNWSVNTLPTISQGSTGTVATLNPTGLLNGTYAAGFHVTAGNSATIGGHALAGTVTGDVLNNSAITMTATVSGNAASTGHVQTFLHHSFGGYNLTNSSNVTVTTGPTTATFLDSQITTDNRDISMTFSAKNQPFMASDIVSISGTGNDVLYVLELNYDTHNQASANQGGQPFLGYQFASGLWTNAALTSSSSLTQITGNYNSLADFHAGYYGYTTPDTNGQGVAWAVVEGDHTFAVIPEPATLGFLSIGFIGLFTRRKRRQYIAAPIPQWQIYGVMMIDECPQPSVRPAPRTTPTEILPVACSDVPTAGRWEQLQCPPIRCVEFRPSI